MIYSCSLLLSLFPFNSFQCTLKPPSCCLRSEEENQKQVRDYMELNGRNDSWISCFYNKLNQTEVIATKGNYQLDIFMSLFWPLLGIAIGLSLLKYVKRLQPGKTKKKLSTKERRHILAATTLTLFLSRRRTSSCFSIRRRKQKFELYLAFGVNLDSAGPSSKSAIPIGSLFHQLINFKHSNSIATVWLVDNHSALRAIIASFEKSVDVFFFTE